MVLALTTRINSVLMRSGKYSGDPADRRQIRIRLTDKARRFEEKYAEVSDEMSRLFYKGFSDEEILRLDADLERVLKNLEQEEQKL